VKLADVLFSPFLGAIYPVLALAAADPAAVVHSGILATPMEILLSFWALTWRDEGSCDKPA
jgi:hypothetical protein